MTARKTHTEKTPFAVSLESWGHTVGGDEHGENQDAFLNWPDHMLWVVADGVGGGDCGAAASRLITQALRRVASTESLDACAVEVRRIMGSVNAILCGQRRATGKLAASTFTALLLHAGAAICLWAGDSRCYLLRDNFLYQCTKDQTLRQEKIDAGELTSFEARRMVAGNVITNAVGVKDTLEIAENRFSLRSGDRFLLCTDGLMKLLQPEAIAEHLGHKSARDAADGIMRSIESRRKPDDTTFITVFLSDPE